MTSFIVGRIVIQYGPDFVVSLLMKGAKIVEDFHDMLLKESRVLESSLDWMIHGAVASGSESCNIKPCTPVNAKVRQST